MEIKEALQIYERLKSTQHHKPFQILVKTAIIYARIRIDWYFWDEQVQINEDVDRSVAHDAFIHACDVLSRVMKENGEETRWRIAIGKDRKSIGDFACLVHAIIGIKAR